MSDEHFYERGKDSEPKRIRLSSNVDDIRDKVWKSITDGAYGFNGLTVPGSNFCGPFNSDMSKRPQGEVDSLCREHDILYSMVDAPYTTWNWADDILRIKMDKLKRRGMTPREWFLWEIVDVFLNSKLAWANKTGMFGEALQVTLAGRIMNCRSRHIDEFGIPFVNPDITARAIAKRQVQLNMSKTGVTAPIPAPVYDGGVVARYNPNASPWKRGGWFGGNEWHNF